MKKLNVHFVNAQLVPFSICKRLLQGQPTSPADIRLLYQNATTSEGSKGNMKSATTREHLSRGTYRYYSKIVQDQMISTTSPGHVWPLCH